MNTKVLYGEIFRKVIDDNPFSFTNLEVTICIHGVRIKGFSECMDISFVESPLFLKY